MVKKMTVEEYEDWLYGGPGSQRLRDLDWRDDTPPSPGWYPASTYNDPESLCFWDGVNWSQGVAYFETDLEFMCYCAISPQCAMGDFAERGFEWFLPPWHPDYSEA